MVSFDCAVGPTTTGGPFVIEGTVDTSMGAGTPEIPGKLNYVLKDCLWVEQNKRSTISLYIDEPLNPSYKGKRVRIEGKVYVDNSDRYIIHVYSVRIID